MTPARAYEIASPWGSYIHATDPGACLYGFRFNDGRPANERHRRACIAYVKDMATKLEWRLKHERHILASYRRVAQTRRDVADLKGLMAFFTACEVAA